MSPRSPRGAQETPTVSYPPSEDVEWVVSLRQFHPGRVNTYHIVIGLPFYFIVWARTWFEARQKAQSRAASESPNHPPDDNNLLTILQASAASPEVLDYASRCALSENPPANVMKARREFWTPKALKAKSKKQKATRP